MMAEKPPVYFGMPLRSSVTTRHWPHISALFRNTIRSIQGQTDGDFRILVACHEIPDMDGLKDPRLEFIVAGHDRPVDIPSQFSDKHAKIRLIGEEICRRGGGYFFLLDADDLVSCNITAFIHRDDNQRGYLIEQGYVLNIGRRSLHAIDDFWWQCGSCAVFYLKPDDLALGDSGLPARIGRHSGHRRYPRISEECGRPLAPLPFPAAIYVRNHGENRSSQRRPWKVNSVRNWFYRAANLFRGLGPIPEGLRFAFGVPYEAGCTRDVVTRWRDAAQAPSQPV